MKTKQLKTSEVELVKADDGNLTGEIKAVIAKMDVIDHDGDIMSSGSVGKQEVVVSAYNHGSWGDFLSPGQLPIGEGRVYETNKEMRFEGKLFTDMAGAGETLKLLKNLGSKQEWSFSLHNVRGKAETVDEKDVYRIESVEVHEVSPVLKGASIGSRTLSVKQRDTEITRLKAELDKAEASIAELQKKLAEARNEHARDIFRNWRG